MIQKNNAASPSTNEDAIYSHSWFVEDETCKSGQGVLTKSGLENISRHKYKAGHYTHLDTYLNSFWTLLTELLPTTMAPNVVTSVGGLHCALSYFILWYYSPNFHENVPNWVVALSGFCTIAYYTFDCMDGKQARRTGNSSPLGQLFDHGVDCICLLAHISGVSSYLMIGESFWYFIMQSSLQVSFFMAQWEECYTGTLPHAMGNWFGVTEVNYGLGIFTLFNSFLDRERLWLSKLKDVIPFDLSVLNGSLLMKTGVLECELRHLALFSWLGSLTILIVGSLARVMTHENVRANSVHLSALSKLISPVLIGIVPFILPESILFHETRSISIAYGILLSHLSMKMIIFSMAKMKYASIQMEVLPLVAVFLWIKVDANFREKGITLLFSGLCVWSVSRLILFVSSAIDEICEKMKINCFKVRDN